ncbi:unnamed protein product [Macrosiphum euphorbiae]|uniref:Uncharacterized protein n=1 Tax=Macrosiphum euphorbiae TaxID=13131 RepID=A0AAV0WNI5_9HEMI|nr:unnamed protein product [Macrosiphum euphorbiae]
MIECNNTVCINDDKPLILVPPGFHVEVLESPEKTPTKVQKKVSLTTSLTPLTVDSSNEQNEKSIQKSNSINKICSSNIVNQSHNNSCYLSDDNNGSASNKVKESNPSSIVENCISLTSVITPDKSSKSFKIQTIEKRVLTRNKNKPDGQNEPISKAKDTSATRVLRKCRKTIAREEISNKALERVRSEAFEDGFGFLRRSHRLSTKTTKELRKCKKTTTRKDISNKALERVRSEAFDYGFGFLRRSPRLSTKTTKELRKCRNTTAKEEISMFKPEEISNKALEKVVRKSYKINTLKKNFNVNGSWTVSRDTTIDGTNTLCINDSKQRLLVPVGFNVEVLETPEKTLTKLQKKNSFTPSLTCPSVDSSIKEHNKMGEIVVERRKILKPMWKVRNVDNVSTLKENFSLNGSWIVSKETMIECNNTVCINDDKPLILVPPEFNVEVLESPEKTPKKVQNKVLLTSSLTPLTVDSSNEPNEKSIQKSNSLDKICSPNIVNQSHNNSCYLSADNNGSASNKVDYGFGSLRRSPRLLIKTTKELSKCRNTTAREDISNKALERVRSGAFEDGFGFLRRSPRLSTKTTKELRKCKKTTARKDISNKALERVRSEAFDYGFGFLRRSPRLSTKTTKELQKCRKTTAREEISNKALGRVRSEAFEDGFGFLRRSLRLSIKTDSAKKIV